MKEEIAYGIDTCFIECYCDNVDYLLIAAFIAFIIICSSAFVRRFGHYNHIFALSVDKNQLSLQFSTQ